MGRVLRGLVFVVCVAAFSGCGTHEDKATKVLNDAVGATASRAKCVKVFDRYKREIADWNATQSSELRPIVERFYGAAPLECPSAKVWNEVAARVAPDRTMDWSDDYERSTVLKGQCEAFQDGAVKAPAC